MSMLKINVNFDLDKETISQIRKANKEIKKYAEVFIDYNSNPIIRPHLTLLMGHIDPGNLDRVREIVSQAKILSTHTEVQLDSPILASNYIIQRVINYKSLLNDCNNLLSELKKENLIFPSTHTMNKGNVAHITLAYVKDPEKIRGKLSSIPAPNKAMLGDIVLSFAGNFGIVYEDE